MKKIAIVAGGNSSERVISVQSGAMVARELENAGYTCYLIDIDRNNWSVKLSNDQLIAIDKNDFTFSQNGIKTKFDCALIAIHGTPGEDGILQAYFELIGIPYTTCGVFASALTFNKNACKQFLNTYGINSARAVLVKKGQEWSSHDIEEKLGMPCFVKPNESGSSFGVTKVKDKNELDTAINHAMSEGDDVIIEEFLSGTEVTCGLVFTKKEKIIFPVTEVVSKKEFFDYEAKYTSGLSEEITPARISDELTGKVQSISSRIYECIGCKGIVRIDYIIKEDEVYFLEVNTVPGMSPNSIVPKQLKEMGTNLANIYKKIIEEIC
jgi:D-alanine-D-alanine ligase